MEEVKKKRGFGSMDPGKHRAIAALGGKAVPAEKRSFHADPSLAAAAGRKGGCNVDPAKRTFSKDREAARRAGAKGGVASHRVKP